MADTGKKTPSAAPRETAQEGGGERFVSRWSRLKQEARELPVETPQAAPVPGSVDPKAPPPELPPTEKLTFESDYRQFLHPKVGEDVRRAALKKLFSDPHFNVMDGLDVYIDDYSKTEPIPAAMLAGLKQAQNIFQWAREDAEERERAQSGAESRHEAGDVGQKPLAAPEAQPVSGGELEVKATQPASAGTAGVGGPEGS